MSQSYANETAKMHTQPRQLAPMRLCLWIISLTALSIISGCQGDSEVQAVNLQQRIPTEQIRTTPPREEFRVAVAAMLSAERTFESYHALLEYLGEYLQKPITFKQRQTYEEINLLLESEQLDLAFICSGAYIVLAEHAPIEIMGVPLINWQPTYQSYVIVPTESSVSTLWDLQGKRFAFTDPLSNTGKLYATYRLAQLGFTPDDFFVGHSYTNSHDHSIQAVAQQHVDGACVDSRVFAQLRDAMPEATTKVRVIEESPPLAMPPVVFGPTVSPSLRLKIREFFFRLHEDAKGRELLKSLGFNKFAAIDDSAYDGIREMRRFIRNAPPAQAP